MIIVILFIFLAFQFIIRFVQMYFLACIYPLAVLFEVHPKMGSVSRNYWKTWISLEDKQNYNYHYWNKDWKRLKKPKE
jgi:cell division protein FtsW (lipid II flippase)